MTGADFGGFILGLVVVAIVAAIVVWLFHWLYLRSSKERAFVRTGMGGQKVVMNGGAFVLPIVHDVIPVNMNTLRLEVSRGRDKALITRDRMRVDVVSEFYVRVQAAAAAIASAAQTLGQRTTQPEALKELLEGKFVDALRTVAAEMTMEELHEKRGEYIRRVRGTVAENLLQNGLELESASLTQLDQTAMEFFNPSNAFDAEGLTRLTEQIERRKKIRNDIEQDTMIQIRNKNLETEKLSLDIDREAESARLAQEREIEIARAGQRAELARERAEKQQLAERAEITAREQIERARVETDRVLEGQRIAKEREIETAEIERRLTLETAEQQRSIAIAQQSKAQSEAQAAADQARALAVFEEEKVFTVRETEMANRRKAIELIARGPGRRARRAADQDRRRGGEAGGRRSRRRGARPGRGRGRCRQDTVSGLPAAPRSRCRGCAGDERGAERAERRGARLGRPPAPDRQARCHHPRTGEAAREYRGHQDPPCRRAGRRRRRLRRRRFRRRRRLLRPGGQLGPALPRPGAFGRRTAQGDRHRYRQGRPDHGDRPSQGRYQGPQARGQRFVIKVYTSSVIDASADAVWAHIRDFNGLPKWHPAIAESRIEGNWPADRVGCIRNFQLRDGGTIREQLLSLSDYDYQCTYSILESPMGVDNYIATLKLTPVTDGNRTFAEWSAEFDPPPGQERKLADSIGQGVFQTGFDSLKSYFGHR